MVLKSIEPSFGTTTTSPLPSYSRNNTTIQHYHDKHHPYTDAEDYATMVFLSLTSMWIVLGNTLVITAFFREKRLRTTTNYYILSLCIADFVIGIFVVNFFTVFIGEKGWHHGVGGCVAWLIVDYGVYQASVFGVLTITLDRFLVIKYPFIKHMRIRTSNRVRFVVLSVWFLSFSLWVPAIVCYLSEVNIIATTQNGCHLPFDGDQGGRGVIVATAVIAYIIPVVVIVFVAVHTYYLLWKSKKLKQRVLKGDGQKTRKESLALKVSDASLQKELLINQEPSEGETKGKQELRKLSSFFRPTSRMFSVIDEAASSRWSSVSFQQITRRISLARLHGLSSSESERMNSPNLSVKKRVMEIQKISRFVLLMAIAFTLTILPFGFLSVLRVYEDIEDRYWRLASILAYLNSALNPLCYAFGNKNFNNALKNLFRRRLSCEESPCTYKRRSVFS